MKLLTAFLFFTSASLIIQTLFSTQIHTTDYVKIYGWPEPFYFYYSPLPFLNDYESHVFRLKGFLVDVSFACVIGIISLAIYWLYLRKKYL